MKSDKPIGKLWKHTPIYALRIVFNKDFPYSGRRCWQNILRDIRSAVGGFDSSRYPDERHFVEVDHKFGEVYFNNSQQRENAIHFLNECHNPRLRSWYSIRHSTYRDLGNYRSILQELTGHNCTYLSTTTGDSYVAISIKTSYEQFQMFRPITEIYEDRLLSYYGILKLHIDRDLRYNIKLLKVIGVKPTMVEICINHEVKECNVAEAIREMI